jgi:hypothetical protein
MTSFPADLWPWLALAGLGMFHGLNPAMGWLFAVALGLNRSSRKAVLISLLPIAVGHAAAVATVLVAVLALGLLLQPTILMRVAGVVLIGWAAWHAAFGHRGRPRVGMRTGLLGLLCWSFLMASGHGAGLMLIPVLAPICLSAPAGEVADIGAGAVPLAVAALSVHTAAMLAAIGTVSLVVYEWIGVDFLRRGWINLDLVWIGALLVCGAVLLWVAP